MYRQSTPTSGPPSGNNDIILTQPATAGLIITVPSVNTIYLSQFLSSKVAESTENSRFSKQKTLDFPKCSAVYACLDY